MAQPIGGSATPEPMVLDDIRKQADSKPENTVPHGFCVKDVALYMPDRILWHTESAAIAHFRQLEICIFRVSLAVTYSVL